MPPNSMAAQHPSYLRMLQLPVTDSAEYPTGVIVILSFFFEILISLFLYQLIGIQILIYIAVYSFLILSSFFRLQLVSTR